MLVLLYGLQLTANVSKIFFFNFHPNGYRRKRPKVDACIFDSVLSHTRRSDASGKKKEEKYSRPLLDVLACGQVSTPHLYRLNNGKFLDENKNCNLLFMVFFIYSFMFIYKMKVGIDLSQIGWNGKCKKSILK